MELLFNTTDALRKVRKAFNMLRQEGVAAHMRFACCSTCGTPATFIPRPLVYVLREDELAFKENGILPIRFVDSDDDPTGTRALGDQVRIILVMNGLEVEWNGDSSRPIMVMA